MNKMFLMGAMLATMSGMASVQLMDQGYDVLEPTEPRPARKSRAVPKVVVIDRVREKPAEKSSSLQRLLKRKARQ